MDGFTVDYIDRLFSKFFISMTDHINLNNELSITGMLNMIGSGCIIVTPSNILIASRFSYYNVFFYKYSPCRNVGQLSLSTKAINK